MVVRGKKLFAYVWKDRSAKTCANSIKNDFERLYVMGKRLNYIDNLRSITVFLLVLYHIALAYNSWGEANYIFFERVNPIASIVVFISPWFMPLMFLLAGVSASFSMKKRGVTAFIKERLKRLGIPLIVGIIFINPILSYVADKSHNGYEGNYFEHYFVYFTRFTDLTGYDGGFTLGHFWFIAVLILISCVSCGIVVLFNHIGKDDKKRDILNIVVFALLAIALFDVSFFGKRIPTYLCVYLIGYYLVTADRIIKRIIKLKWFLVGGWIIASVVNILLFVYIEQYELLNTICNYLAFSFGIPALFCLAHEYLDFSNSVSQSASRLSYVFYSTHFPIAILCQYLISMTGVNCILNFIISLIIAYPVTIISCWLIDKLKFLRVLFGVK